MRKVVYLFCSQKCLTLNQNVRNTSPITLFLQLKTSRSRKWCSSLFLKLKIPRKIVVFGDVIITVRVSSSAQNTWKSQSWVGFCDNRALIAVIVELSHHLCEFIITVEDHGNWHIFELRSDLYLARQFKYMNFTSIVPRYSSCCFCFCRCNKRGMEVLAVLGIEMTESAFLKIINDKVSSARKRERERERIMMCLFVLMS